MNIKEKSDLTWIQTCKALDDIFRNYADRIPLAMLKKNWPGNDPDIWKSGSDLTWIFFSYHFANGEFETLNCTLDTDYCAVPWAAFPALLSTAKKFMVTALKERVKGREKRFELRRGIDNCAPYALSWGDWDEDDDLDIECCSPNDWDSTMNFENDLLRKVLLSAFSDSDEEDVDIYVGCYDGDDTKVIPLSYSGDIDATITELKQQIGNLSQAGFVPLILQTSEDDCDSAAAIYWMVRTKKGDENK